MPYIFRLTIRSARLALWPAIIFNTGVIALAAGASFSTSLLLSIALSCVASFGFIINDCADVVVDSVNRVGRLETATGEERRKVGLLGNYFLCAGLISSLFVSVIALAVMASIAVGLLVYTHFARKRLFLATLIASLLSSSPLWLANIVLGVRLTNLQGAIIVAVFLFLMAREMIFDVEDQPGDQRGGRRTLATMLGASRAISVSFIINALGAGVLAIVAALAVEATRWWPIVLADVTLLIVLILPAAWNLQSGHANARAFARFTFLSRIAMLLIPLIWIVL